MKAYIADIIPRIQQFSEKLDNITLLTNQHWVLIDDNTNQKHVYIFRSNNELLVSIDGKVHKARWEYLGNRSILIDKANESFLFKHGFFDSNVLALKRDNSVEFTLFVNENKFQGEINSSARVLEFLTGKYLADHEKNELQDKTGIVMTETVGELTNKQEKDDFTAWIPLILIVLIMFIAFFLAVTNA